MRSFGTAIDGGADTLLDALLKRDCTVMAPAFTEPQFGLPAPAGMRPMRNGLDYAAVPSGTTPAAGAAYSVDCGLINRQLGALPTTLVGRIGAVRGRHPLIPSPPSAPRRPSSSTPKALTMCTGPSANWPPTTARYCSSVSASTA